MTMHGADISGSLKTRSVAVEVKGLVKAYGEVQAVRGVDLGIEPGSTVTLLGPSGCGKTTTLRCIAGLETPTAGKITIGDRVVYDGERGVFVEPERRNIGMVFQSYAIWPHMTVGGNVAFPLKIARTPKAVAEEKLTKILELVGLSELKDRSAAALSGGQQQRVALARALVHQPSVVLFDEPLSNLDANLRERMRTELQLLQAELGFTAIYVTHDQEEAMALSDHVVIINRGLIEQQGSPEDVFNRPATAFTARFLGYSNALRGRVVRTGGDFVGIAGDDGMELTARWQHARSPRPNEDAIVAFRADAVEIMPSGAAGENTFTGKVEGRAFLGTYIDYAIRVGTLQLKAESGVGEAASRGSDVLVRVAPENCHGFPASAS